LRSVLRKPLLPPLASEAVHGFASGLRTEEGTKVPRISNRKTMAGIHLAARTVNPPTRSGF